MSKLKELKSIDLNKYLEDVVLPEEYNYDEFISNMSKIILNVECETKARRVLNRLQSIKENMSNPAKRLERLQVGSKVVIRDDLEVGQILGNDMVVSSMLSQCGETVTVKVVHLEQGKFRIKESGFNWTPEMVDWSKGVS